MKHTKTSIAKFVEQFNADHKYTKINETRFDGDGQPSQFGIKVLSSIDGRKTIGTLFCNINADWTEETMSDIINDKYRGLREFLDSNPGMEEAATYAKRDKYGRAETLKAQA